MVYKGEHSKSTGLYSLKTYVEAAIDLTIKNQYHLLKSVHKFFTKLSEIEYFHLLVKLPYTANIHYFFEFLLMNFNPKHVKLVSNY